MAQLWLVRRLVLKLFVTEQPEQVLALGVCLELEKVAAKAMVPAEWTEERGSVLALV